MKELRECKTILKEGFVENLIARFQVKPTLEEEIVKLKLKDPLLRNLTEEVSYERRTNYEFKRDDTLLKENKLCVPYNKALKESILEEDHSSACEMHTRSTNMYRTLKANYLWHGMWQEIAKFVDKCLI